MDSKFFEKIRGVFKIVPKGILCLKSALSYHELTTFNPWQYEVAVERSSKVAIPKYPPIKLLYFSKALYELCKIEVLIQGHTLRVYDVEKAGLKASGTNNVFTLSGPPGVGKTEMAKYFTDIMFENNLLSGKKFISINAAQLKAKYVGHTAYMIASIFSANDAIFLDEIYSLAAESNGEMDSLSQEAMAQLCVEMEKHGREKLIILAGYGGNATNEKSNKMKKFLSANPGIASRVTFNIDFPTYSDHEMLEILLRMADNADYELELGWREIAQVYFKERRKAESYGNAREARRLLQNAATAQALRLSDSEPDVSMLKLITCEDLSSSAKKLLDAEKKLGGTQKAKIGFGGIAND